MNKIVLAFYALGYHLSIKLHILNSQLDQCPKNLGAMGNKQEEWFQQDLKIIEKPRLLRQKYDAGVLSKIEMYKCKCYPCKLFPN